jgi:hypothetical protein
MRRIIRGISKRRRVLSLRQSLGVASSLLLIAAFSLAFGQRAAAQDQDDPPGRVARLGYMEGSVSFQPAGEDEWVDAVPNRPMTTGDKLWADRDSRAEVQLGSATLDLAPNTGFSFLNLDDRTIQIQLSAGSLNVRVWDLDRDNVFEIDTPNQAFTVDQPGRYRLDASEDGNYTVVTVREGGGESTGNGQSYTMHAGQRFTFSGTSSLNAEVEQIGGPDDFDNWSDRRENRYQDSPSARYCSRRVVGFEDLDDNGDWRPTPDYGYAWFPRVDPGWAPYHNGHWAWIDPWGWTWVDDARWGYAPFHYGRWFSVGGRWGWVPGPREERPVYAPALVAFVGGGFAAGATVAWFPLGPREVYVPSYRVSEAYVNRVNVTNTTVNTTIVHNVYNTTIVNNNTTINNVTYVNRNVRGGMTAVPQQAFASAQPVARTAVAVNAQQFSRAPVSARAAVPPARQAVMGAHANTANRVAAPPAAIASRPVVAKATPPPPAPSFAQKQQVLTQHPGQPVARQQMQQMRPDTTAAPRVRQAPPARAATPSPAMNRPANAPGNQPGSPAGNMRPGGNPPAPAQPAAPAMNRPGNAPANQPGNPAGNMRPGNPPPAAQPAPAFRPGAESRPQPVQPNGPPARNDRPPSAQPNNRPQPNEPQPNRAQPAPPAPNNRPEEARPNQPQPPARNDRLVPPPENRAQPNPDRPSQPAPNRPEPNRAEPPARNERPAPPPENRAQPNPEPPRQPVPNRPEPNRPEPPARNERPAPPPPENRAQPNNRAAEPPPRNDRPPQAAPSNQRPESHPPAETRPAPQQRPQPDNKKRQDEQKKPQ